MSVPPLFQLPIGSNRFNKNEGEEPQSWEVPITQNSNQKPSIHLEVHDWYETDRLSFSGYPQGMSSDWIKMHVANERQRVSNGIFQGSERPQRFSTAFNADPNYGVFSFLTMLSRRHFFR